MKKNIVLILLLSTGIMAFSYFDFFTEQLKYSRVRQANMVKGSKIAAMFIDKNIPLNNFDLFIRAFKEEEIIEVWAKAQDKSDYQLLNTYSFCASTGTVGPKRRSGDKQIPEGFYTIDKFNPESMYHLSFRVNYPNKSDLVFADKLNPGGDIFIHGDCLTIGCIPIGNDNIEELYLIAAHAKSVGGKTDVHIFPGKLSDANYEKLKKAHAADESLLTFWSWLKPGYDAFEQHKMMPVIKIENDGSYRIDVKD